MSRGISSGMVYQGKYRDRHGNICLTKTWTIKYYIHGKGICVSTGTDDREEAVRILRQRLAKAARYSLYSEHMELVRVGQLLDLVVEDYRFYKRSTTYCCERRINRHLRPYFGRRKAR